MLGLRPGQSEDNGIRRAERLFRLVQELRTRGVARAEDLALRLEVSTRTVYRDIAHLQGSGLPIEGAAGIGYLLRPGFDLPNVTFTHDQVEALALGLAFAERAGDPVLASAAREVRAKLQAGMPDPGARRLADAPFFSLHRPPPPSLRTLRSLREAIRQRHVLRLAYRDGEARPSDRRIRPLALWCFAEGWMVSAWCELRQDFRTFRLDRIAALAQTGVAFADDPATSLSAFLAREDCEGPGHDRTAGPWQEAGWPAVAEL
ncbi:helix-turn-helix transcriptional regulator [Tabrizicola aquatica]|uniref:helix-turn-helix transcriptional regulator n=1 Tax=Tabrizicola aquatica TaxID=909926 RepID=UPI002481F2E2|nr:YafY family protein [Tabrizicola aquatica]